MDPTFIQLGDPRYPAAIERGLGAAAPISLAAMGNVDLLQRKVLALFCSVRCPGSLILRAHDLAQRLRETGPMVAGGFHSPMEKEWLRVLLRGPQPVVVCPARDIVGIRLPAEYREPMSAGRLLLLSGFPAGERRVTAETALPRNRFVAALADSVLVVHAEPGGKTEQFCRELLAQGKPLYTLEGDANRNLLELGARPVNRADDLPSRAGYGQTPFPPII